MNFKGLETFYWIVRLGTFNAAAEQLRMTQSAVSVRIRELESDLGIALFERRGRGVTVTPQGREIFHHASRIIGELEHIYDSARRDAAISGVVRIGTVGMMTLSWLPAMLGKLQARYPHLLTEIKVDLAPGLVAALRHGDLDVVFVAGPVDGPELRITPLSTVDMVWAASPALIARDVRLSPVELADYPLITLTRDTLLYRQMTDWFSKYRVSPKKMHVCGSVTLLTQLVNEGFAASVMPQKLIHDASPIHALSGIEPMPPIGFHAIVSEVSSNRASKVVIDLASECANEWASG
ncbi:LysR family transcriptional regulator [Paraburkholderia sp. J63]|uniref:LysR family transcriptional regulator n=1 Tax=Paraburkholderia sp. J63 TaxID=2805434 RepID=UPI002ABEA0E8|nr:LysR family transcriptional regulator [Paraburkholderia sp. J63]